MLGNVERDKADVSMGRTPILKDHGSVVVSWRTKEEEAEAEDARAAPNGMEAMQTQPDQDDDNDGVLLYLAIRYVVGSLAW